MWHDATTGATEYGRGHLQELMVRNKPARLERCGAGPSAVTHNPTEQKTLTAGIDRAT